MTICLNSCIMSWFTGVSSPGGCDWLRLGLIGVQRVNCGPSPSGHILNIHVLKVQPRLGDRYAATWSNFPNCRSTPSLFHRFPSQIPFSRRNAVILVRKSANRCGCDVTYQDQGNIANKAWTRPAIQSTLLLIKHKEIHFPNSFSQIQRMFQF